MKAQEIQVKIDKVKETIAKKEALIQKRTAQAEKIIGKMRACRFMAGKEFVLVNNDCEGLYAFYKQVDEAIRNDVKSDGYIADDADRDEVYWMNCDLWDCVDSIKNAQSAIVEKNETLARYDALMEKAQKKQEALENLPQCMKDWMKDMIEIWDSWDAWKKASVIEDGEKIREIEKQEHAREKDLEYNYVAIKNDEIIKALRDEITDIRREHSEFEWKELAYMNEDEIHDRNVKSAQALVENLYDRVCHIVGVFEDASDLKVSRTNQGWAVINGTVKGNGKIAKVQSIGAGGWNIQRFHIRVLVNEIKSKKGVA